MIPRRYVKSPKRERSNVFVAVISLHEVKYKRILAKLCVKIKCQRYGPKLLLMKQFKYSFFIVCCSVAEMFPKQKTVFNTLLQKQRDVELTF